MHNREQVKAINKLKLKFYNNKNISHEINTHLALIKASLNKLEKEDLEPSVNKKLAIIKRNSGRLLKVVEQYLNYIKIEHNKKALNSEINDLVMFFKDIIFSFEGLTSFKRIKVETDFCNQLFASFDSVIMGRIFFNLFLNAINYTSENGKISIKLFAENKKITKIKSKILFRRGF